MTDRSQLKNRLFISTTADDCRPLALGHGLGLEIAEFCWAQRIDRELEATVERCRELIADIPRVTFHAPFAELAPCAIDPRARELAASRYRQSLWIASRLGAELTVVHGGFVPEVYFPEYFVEQSIIFWKLFLREQPKSIRIALENVMDPSPEMLVEIVRGVDDPRLGLCLDAGHANCSVSRVPPLDWIGPMKDKLFHVHIHNNMGERDLHSPLGEGTVDMERFIDTVLENCPNATFTIENVHAAPSVSWLEEKGYIE